MYRTASLVAVLALFSAGARADVTRFMGGGRGDGTVGTNSFVQPWGVSTGPDGAVLIADSGGNGVRRLAPNAGSTVQRIAGTYRGGQTGDGGPATDALLFFPISAVTNTAHDVYISESGGGGRIRVIDGATGKIRTVVSSSGASSLFAPMQLAFTSDGSLLVADYKNFRVVKYQLPCGTTCGPPIVVAGGANGPGIDNVPAQNSPLKTPKGVAAMNSQIYIADADDGRVRVVLSNGTIITAAAGLKGPVAVAAAPTGDAVYVAEWSGNRISKISGGTVTPVLGACAGVTIGSCQPQSASAPVFSNNPLAQPITAPTGVALSPDGTKLYAASQSDQVVYVLDLGTNQVAPVATATSSFTVASLTSTPTFTLKPPPTQTATATRLPTCNVPCQ